MQEIEGMKPLMEWSSENLLALSAPEAEAQRLANYLHSGEQQGLLQYETGRGCRGRTGWSLGPGVVDSFRVTAGIGVIGKLN